MSSLGVREAAGTHPTHLLLLVLWLLGEEQEGTNKGTEAGAAPLTSGHAKLHCITPAPSSKTASLQAGRGCLQLLQGAKVSSAPGCIFGKPSSYALPALPPLRPLKGRQGQRGRAGKAPRMLGCGGQRGRPELGASYFIGF